MRLYRTLTGLTSGFEQTLIKAAWSADGERVGAGGGDRTCTVWDVEKTEILYKVSWHSSERRVWVCVADESPLLVMLQLPGHRGTCTAMDFHPREPVIVSSSFDMSMLLGELADI